jgi:hypothetical protein
MPGRHAIRVEIRDLWAAPSSISDMRAQRREGKFQIRQRTEPKGRSSPLKFVLFLFLTRQTKSWLSAIVGKGGLSMARFINALNFGRLVQEAEN